MSNPRVLIAEDVESNYIYLKALLKKVSCDVIWAENGLKALDIIKDDGSIDLVLMDLQMPLLSGIDVVKEVRALGFDLPIIAQTAFSQDDDIENLLESGVNDVFIKPIRPHHFYKVISNYINITKF
ncbi:MAG: response regulator [Prolixibacteraceae bacterium]|jgi:CheY-like chemotaxis protein|nr:response regulator [Prolixibacteraceae bacterium]